MSFTHTDYSIYRLLFGNHTKDNIAMLDTILQIGIFIVTLLLLVTVHEYGHFWVAKRLGVKVLRFSVGFGKPIWRKMGKDGTEYVIAFLPLGGYVMLLDEREMPVDEADLPRAFNRKPLWVRTLIALAGPCVNLAFGVVVFAAMWMIGVEQPRAIIATILPHSIAAESKVPVGAEIVAVDQRPVNAWQQTVMLMLRHLGNYDEQMQLTLQNATRKAQTYTLPLTHWVMGGLEPDPLKSLGIVPYYPPGLPIIYKLKSDEPAMSAGLQQGDQFVAVNGEPLTDWMTFSKYVQHHPQQMLHLTVLRHNQTLHFDIQTDRRLAGFRWVGYLGVEVAPPVWPKGTKLYLQLPFIPAVMRAFQDVYDISVFNFVILEKMLTGKVSFQSLGGPIAIYQTSSLAFQQGLVVYLGFLGFISVMLGCINLVPFPGLDGGHVLFFAIEAIIRRPIPVAVQALVLRLGFIALIMLMVNATVNDILRAL